MVGIRLDEEPVRKTGSTLSRTQSSSLWSTSNKLICGRGEKAAARDLKFLGVNRAGSSPVARTNK